ncbi:MAG: hypothetical protein ACREEV_16065, partial [Dongiaceae bacterium]
MACIALAAAVGSGDQTLASAQSKTPDMKATPLTPTETLHAPDRQSAAQPIPTDPFMRRVTMEAVTDLA